MATVQTLVQLAKIRPKLLVPHVMTLQPYLATKCEVSGGNGLLVGGKVESLILNCLYQLNSHLVTLHDGLMV